MCVTSGPFRHFQSEYAAALQQSFPVVKKVDDTASAAVRIVRHWAFQLIWEGARSVKDFYHGRANTLMLILDTVGTAFGRCTRVECESRVWNRKIGEENNGQKGDDGVQIFFFTMRNPHRREEKKQSAIYGHSHHLRSLVTAGATVVTL
jgi:hypothetical protein